MPEEDQVTDRGSTHKKFSKELKIVHVVPEISWWTDRQTDRHRKTDRQTDRQMRSSQYFTTAPAGEVII